MPAKKNGENLLFEEKIKALSLIIDQFELREFMYTHTKKPMARCLLKEISPKLRQQTKLLATLVCNIESNSNGI